MGVFSFVHFISYSKDLKDVGFADYAYRLSIVMQGRALCPSATRMVRCIRFVDASTLVADGHKARPCFVNLRVTVTSYPQWKNFFTRIPISCLSSAMSWRSVRSLYDFSSFTMPFIMWGEKMWLAS